MARLVIKTAGLGLDSLDLRLGVNRIGRAPDNDFILTHPTISSHHCELILSAAGVTLRDCGSTNGVFLNRQRITEVQLEAGQQLRFGDVELAVESTEVLISIPKIEPEKPAPPPVILENGALLCSRHPEQMATFQCTACHEVMCDICVRRIRMIGGHTHYLCAICHHHCERIGEPADKCAKGFLGFLQKTLRKTFTGSRSRRK